ncbi:hypothetical protein HXX76_011030 [Chlamydomonas incerta]|uniref:Ankyrin repeat domain-containing protein n=1 Tax=Chlamydomonas incerta TaxID=51695 RepID=A0A835T0F6_CHLIN|nr:hypothetical protein HXX76_011030 [Chlamydomonas incerta]|eukprot:KAG2429261.1 hypothetical protein HXX76_011030 [Chlamydomonas incerta]
MDEASPSTEAQAHPEPEIEPQAQALFGTNCEPPAGQPVGTPSPAVPGQASHMPQDARAAQPEPHALPDLPITVFFEACAHLEPNFQACCARLVCKAAAAEFGNVVRLSQPCPDHAFAAHWGRPGATRHLSLAQRRQLICLVASSGVLANVQVAVDAARCSVPPEALAAAAAAGHLEVCQFLWPVVDERCSSDASGGGDGGGGSNAHPPYSPPLHPNVRLQQLARRDPLVAAALAGRPEVCAWLLTQAAEQQGARSTGGAGRRPVSLDLTSATLAAVLGGHAALYRTLRDRLAATSGHNEPLPPVWLLAALAEAGNRAALVRAVGQLRQRRASALDALASEGVGGSTVLAAAARSTTPDWLDKVDFLLRGPECRFSWPDPDTPAHDAVAETVLPRPGVDVSPQLNKRGFWATQSAAGLRTVAAAGQAGVLRELLQAKRQLVRLVAGAAGADGFRGLEQLGMRAYIDPGYLQRVASAAAVAAAEANQLECLNVALQHAPPTIRKTALLAACRRGHLAAAQRLVGCLPLTPGVTLAAELLVAAAESGSLQLVRWLVEGRRLHHRLGPQVFKAAVRGGCCELVAWLAAQGCADGHTPADILELCTVALRAGDVAMLQQLSDSACYATRPLTAAGPEQLA